MVGPAATARRGGSTGPVLVAGIGLPWLQGVDLGMFVRRIEGPGWPKDVLVEDLTFPAHRALDRLLEVAPSRVVLVVAKAAQDTPGTVRRSVLDLTPPPDAEVHDRLVESVTLGIVDVDHVLAVARYWRALPAGTVVIEVEPGERGFELGLSEELDVAERVLALVQEEVVHVGRRVQPW